MHRRLLLVATAGTAATLAAPRLAHAAWPDRPVRVIVPYAPGTNSDVQTRLVTARMADRLGQPFVVENRAGAGGSVGAEVVAKARPDGYTLLTGSNGPLAINPALQPRLPYRIEDFAALGLLSLASHTITVRKESPYNTLAEFVTAAKLQAGRISMGTSGTGSATHFTLEQFQAASGARMTHVPYRGSSVAVPDLIAGNVDSVCSELTTVLPTWRGDRTRILALCAASRSPLAPDIPTATEAGLPGLVGASWVGLLAPAGTPAEAMQALSRALVATLEEPAIIDRMKELGADPAGAAERTPEGFTAYIRLQADQTKRIAEATQMRLE